MSSSSSSLEKAIDEYQDVSSGSGGSYESGSWYSFKGIPGDAM